MKQGAESFLRVGRASKSMFWASSRTGAQVRNMTKIVFSQRLLDDLIAVALLDKAEGVIKLPDWQRVLRGEVVAVGPGRMLPLGERAPMECRVGDQVSFSATA